MPQRKIVSSSKKISPAKEILGYVIVFTVLAAMVGIASMTVAPLKESGKYSPKADISNIGVVRANAAEIEAESEADIETESSDYSTEDITSEVIIEDVADESSVAEISDDGNSEEESELKILDYMPLCEVEFSADYQTYLYELCQECGCPYELALATIYVESSFRPDVNNAGINTDGTTDYGLMGINDRYVDYNCQKYLDGYLIDMYDPYENMKLGVHILADNYKNWGTAYDAACAYNLGSNGWAQMKASEGCWYYGDKVVEYMALISEALNS